MDVPQHRVELQARKLVQPFQQPEEALEMLRPQRRQRGKIRVDLAIAPVVLRQQQGRRFVQGLLAVLIDMHHGDEIVQFRSPVARCYISSPG